MRLAGGGKRGRGKCMEWRWEREGSMYGRCLEVVLIWGS
jgi:hypothetical protein